MVTLLVPAASLGSIYRLMNRSSNGSEALQVAEDILPVAELKAHLSERSRELRSCRRPLVVAQNGQAAAATAIDVCAARLHARARHSGPSGTRAAPRSPRRAGKHC